MKTTAHPASRILPGLTTAVAAVSFGILTAHSADLAVWDFALPTPTAGNEAELAPDTYASGLSVGSLKRGSGVAPSPAGSSFSASGWSLAALDTNDYFEFGITIPPGDTLDIDTIGFGERRSGTGPRDFELRSSLDGFAAAIGGTPFNVPDDTNTRYQTLTLGDGFNAVTGTITFRLYGYTAEGATGTWRLANQTAPPALPGLVISGTYAPSSLQDFTLSFNPAAIAEPSGTTTGTITRSGSTVAALTVSLTSSDTSEATVPATVEIPAGYASATFSVNAVDDYMADGAQTVAITASANGFNPKWQNVTVNDDGDPALIVINEILYDPAGDANGDGATSAVDDEFVEVVNVSGAALDMSGWQIFDATQVLPRHVFPAGTTVPAGGAVVVFGGGSPTGVFGGSLVQVASDVNKLSLNNTGDIVRIDDALNRTRAIHVYANNSGVDTSLNLDTDATGASYVPHNTIPGASGAAYSPGTKANGSPFISAPYSGWIAGYFPGEANPDIIGFNADPDGDAIPNGLEAVYGSAPNAAAAAPALTTVSATPGSMTVRHPRTKGFLSDVSSSYQWSTDLLNWQANNAESGGVSVNLTVVAITPVSAAQEMADVAVTVTSGSPNRVYVRLRATGP